jgi:hypothetical protein
MKKEITHESRFSCTTTADENNDGILGDSLHIEPFNVEINVG